MPFPDAGMRTGDTYRPLSPVELGIVFTLLSADFPGRDELLEQLSECKVRTLDENGSLEFLLYDKRPAMVVRRIPVEAEMEDKDGIIIHILLHVVSGFLKELEIYRDDSGLVLGMIREGSLRLVVL
jgi:uncharacterized protein DUF6984